MDIVCPLKYFVSWLILIAINIDACAFDISPFDFGLADAKSSIEKFYILRQTHLEALKYSATIDYTGIDTLEIEIPDDAQSIPLPYNTNFRGLKLYITNRSKDFRLFVAETNVKPIEVHRDNLISGDYRNITGLNYGLAMLIIKDMVPLFNERKNYGFPIYRQDLLLISNGEAVNEPIMNYSDSISCPSFLYCIADPEATVISNIDIIRTNESSFKTFCFAVENRNNVTLENISVTTSESTLFADKAISFINCSNVTCKNITINGTYSKVDKYGYGFYLDNVYNSEFIRVKTSSLWGIFGTNNINRSSIVDSDINRFDVHCYGKDICCRRSVFRDLYNQFSTITGYIIFEKCSFIKSVPVLIEDTYSSFMKCDIKFYDCNIQVDPLRPYIVDLRTLSLGDTLRSQLKKRNWPNLFLNDIHIQTQGAEKYFLYRIIGNQRVDIPASLSIEMHNVSINSNDLYLYLTNATASKSSNIDIKLYGSTIPIIVK